MNGIDFLLEVIVLVFYNLVFEVFLIDVGSLLVLFFDQQYQFWVIVDGVFVSMGVFEVNIDILGFQLVVYVENVQVYVVIFEFCGGSEMFILEQMYVIGEI